MPCPADRVNRHFHAPHPNALWVSDFTYVATWQGFVYVAFVIDVFARHIVGWRASRTAHASFVLDALEQALHERRPVKSDGLVHHSDRGGVDIEDTLDAGDEALKGGAVELVGATEAVHDARLGSSGLGVPDVLGERVVGDGGSVAVPALCDAQVYVQMVGVQSGFSKAPLWQSCV